MGRTSRTRGRHERCIQFFVFRSENLKGRDHAENVGVDGSIILEWILGPQFRKVSAGLIWFRIGTGGCP